MALRKNSGTGGAAAGIGQVSSRIREIRQPDGAGQLCSTVPGSQDGVERDRDQDPSLVQVGMWNWKAIDVVNAHVRNHDRLMSSLEVGIGLLPTGTPRLQPLITHRYPLEEISTAFSNLAEKPRGFIRLSSTFAYRPSAKIRRHVSLVGLGEIEI